MWLSSRAGGKRTTQPVREWDSNSSGVTATLVGLHFLVFCRKPILALGLLVPRSVVL